jgi:predicted transcriptional regulator
MAKVEIEIRDDLLDHVDDYASRADETREEFLRRVIAKEVDRCHEKLRKEIEELRAGLRPLDLGGKTAAELIREGRDSR